MNAPSRSKKSSTVRKTQFQPSDLYKIRNAVTSSGEHRPLLTSAISGLPVLRVNQYMLVSRRDRCQVNTMKSELGVLSILLSWADTQGIDLDAEVDRGIGLDQAQITSLVHGLKLDYRKQTSDDNVRGPNVVALKIAIVSAEVWANRIAVARDFIIWGLSNVLARCEPGSLHYEHIRERRADVATEMNSRIPPTRGSGKRLGLTPELKQRLFDVTRPAAIENPPPIGAARAERLDDRHPGSHWSPARRASQVANDVLFTWPEADDKYLAKTRRPGRSTRESTPG